MASPRRPKSGSGKLPSAYFAGMYDKWSIPMSDAPGAPQVTSLHDGLDWVQVHAPRAFFEELAERVEAGDTDDLLKWLTVWSMARHDPDPNLCGAPTRMGNPCHHNKPCRHHPGGRRNPS